jgi:MFS family permease
MFRNRSLAALFTLAVLGGFSMFSLLFYAPLLFQGGFGMSPKDAGLLITPLVVFITIGSIVNGRIVTRLKNANVMLYVGFGLLVVACLGVVIATHAMPRSILMVFMLIGGLGLGFVMPNLTVFAQQTAGRQHLGIATALLQSLRMIGGMIGTALTGTLVAHLYASGVQLALEKDHATHWLSDLADPQILINREAQDTLLSQLTAAGHNGALLLESAREALVAAIHIGLALAAVVAVISLWQSRRVPPVRLKGPVDKTILAE